MRTKLYVLLFEYLLLLSACKKDENSSERDNIQSETTSEEALNSGTQQAKEATGTQQVDNSKNRPALQQVDNKNIEHNLLLTYNLEEPTSSNTASADSHLKIIFASDDANPALKSEYRDKELGKLVTISPKIDGEWFGSKSGKNIVFKPTEEWSANTKYTVTMDKTLFNTKYKVNKLSDSFKSEAFTYYINKENLLEGNKIPYRVDWVKNVKLEDLSRWQHFGLGGNEFVLRDYPDTAGMLLTCRNFRTHNDVKFEKDIIVEQLYFG